MLSPSSEPEQCVPPCRTAQGECEIMKSRVGLLWLAMAGTVVAPAALAQDAPASPRPMPANDPGTWLGPDDYPPDALAAHAEGAVGFALSVDASGSVTGCTIAVSSGSGALDQQTCHLLMARAKFNAVAAGAAPRSFSSRLRWVLPAQAPAPASVPPLEVPSGTSTSMGAAELAVGSDGLVKACAPFDHPYVNVAAPPDLCSSFPVGSRYGRPTVHAGKPVRRRVRIQMTIDTSLIPGS